jgi:hypothetical protein
MKDAVSDPAHLSKACPKQDRGKNDLVVGCMVGSCRVAQAADIVGKDAGDESRLPIRHHAHGVADPVMAAIGFRRPPVLVHKYADGKVVVVLHRFPIWGLMAVNRIRRESADAHRVGPKKIGRFFDVEGKECRIIRKGSLLAGHHPIHEGPKVLKHLRRGSRHGMLRNEPLPFLLKLRTKVTSAARLNHFLVNSLTSLSMILLWRSALACEEGKGQPRFK